MTKETHLTPQLFDRLMREEISGAEARDLVWHLMEACPECAEVAEKDWILGVEPALGSVTLRLPGLATEEDPLGGSFDRVRERLAGTFEEIFRQQDAAPGLMLELSRHPFERQRLLVANNPRFHVLPLVDALLERAWEEGFDAPAQAEATAELALEVIDQVDARILGEEVLNDFRGRGWAFRGNFRRIQSDFRGAETAFRRAEVFLEAGTGDPLERARLLGLWANLLSSQLRFTPAQKLLLECVHIYEALGERHLAGRALFYQALLDSEQGNPAGAITVLEEALSRIEVEREPRLLLVAQHNLVSFLSELGRYEEALARIPAVRRLASQHGIHLDLLRLRWVEAQVLLGLGHDARAEAGFLEVRKGFLEQGIGYDAAAVSLELAVLYLRQGRTAEIKELAAEMLPIFQSRDVHQEAVAALMLFRRAAEMETLTVRRVEEIAKTLAQIRVVARTRQPSQPS